MWILTPHITKLSEQGQLIALARLQRWSPNSYSSLNQTLTFSQHVVRTLFTLPTAFDLYFIYCIPYFIDDRNYVGDHDQQPTISPASP